MLFRSILPNSVGIAVVGNIVDKERSVLGLLCLTSVWTAIPTELGSIGTSPHSAKYFQFTSFSTCSILSLVDIVLEQLEYVHTMELKAPIGL